MPLLLRLIGLQFFISLALLSLGTKVNVEKPKKVKGTILKISHKSHKIMFDHISIFLVKQKGKSIWPMGVRTHNI